MDFCWLCCILQADRIFISFSELVIFISLRSFLLLAFRKCRLHCINDFFSLKVCVPLLKKSCCCISCAAHVIISWLYVLYAPNAGMVYCAIIIIMYFGLICPFSSQVTNSHTYQHRRYLEKTTIVHNK